MTEKSFDEMTPDEQREDIRRRSPAIAFAQDAGILPGGSPPTSPLAAMLDSQGEETIVPGEVAAAIETNRAELLLPLRRRVEGGEAIPPMSAAGLYVLLSEFYKDNTQGPVLVDLLEALATVEEQVKAMETSVSLSLFLLDKVRLAIETFDHRSKEVLNGLVPINQIPDGQSRSTPL